MRTLVWIGPAFTIEESLASSALAPAASRWQQGLLGAIANEGVKIEILTHHAERLWPFGHAWIPGAAGFFHGMPRTAVAFTNLPGLREPTLARAYRAGIDELCHRGIRPDVISSYNVWGPVARACRYASTRYGIPWIPFVLDHNRPTADWSNFLPSVADAAGVAFVSHWAFRHAPVRHGLHLDAGVSSVPDVTPPRPHSRMLLYSGALHQWGGIENLLDAMPLLDTTDVSLVVVGRGGSPDIMRRLATTPRVEYLGGVDESTLEKLSTEAEVLANPRPHDVQGNEMNFPSKLLHYLSWLKPVATTLTPGVAPEYEDVVIAARDGSPAAFAAAVDRAFGLSDTEWTSLADRIRVFLRHGRLWSQQGRRFVHWVDDLVGVGRTAT